MIKLHTLRIENFRSIIEPKIISFPDKGIIRFRGKNGAGKTSVMEALYFCLYNKSIKSGGTVQSNLTGNSVKVTLHFSVDGTNYQLTRGAKSVELLKEFEGNYKPEGLYIKDINARIAELLGMTAMQFQNAIIMASASRRLGDYDENERREFFKSLFDLDWVDALRAKVQVDYNRIKAELSSATAQLNSATQRQTTANSNLGNYQKLQAEAEAIYAEQLAEATKLFTQADHVLRNLPEPSALAPLSLELQQIQLKEAEEVAMGFMTDLARGNTRLSHIKSETITKPKPIATGCTACGREFDHDSLCVARATYDKALLEAEEAEKIKLAKIDELNEELSQLRDSYKLARAGADGIIAHIKQLTDAHKALERTYNEQLQAHNSAKLKFEMAQAAHRAKLLAKPTDYSEYIEKATLELYEAIQAKEKLESNILSLNEEFELANFWYTDALGPNGIKAHVTKALFVKLNKALDRYSKLFGLAVRFTIDAEATRTKTELIIARADGVIIPYGDLSQGQVTRVQLTLQLGLFDLIADGRWPLMLIDEPFLGLDEDACMAIMELMPVLSKDRAIFIIDQQLGEFPNSKTYTFELVNKQTVMK